MGNSIEECKSNAPFVLNFRDPSPDCVIIKEADTDDGPLSNIEPSKTPLPSIVTNLGIRNFDRSRLNDPTSVVIIVAAIDNEPFDLPSIDPNTLNSASSTWINPHKRLEYDYTKYNLPEASPPSYPDTVGQPPSLSFRLDWPAIPIQDVSGFKDPQSTIISQEYRENRVPPPVIPITIDSPGTPIKGIYYDELTALKTPSNRLNNSSQSDDPDPEGSSSLI